DLTISFGIGVADLWSARRRGASGGQARYSGLAIQICLSLWLVSGLPRRRKQDFVRSIGGRTLVGRHQQASTDR
ncbi:MAG: transposase, partial [Paracoccaceae bacterium]|nr:transposase [Paracoccaceae bacterium]